MSIRRLLVRSVPPLLALVASLGARDARALMPRETALADGEAPLPARPFILQQAEGDGPGTLASTDSGWQAFRAEVTGEWHARFDLRTGRPSMVWGSGQPWIPGRGNTLTWSDITATGTAPSSVKDGLALLTGIARRFVETNEALLRVPQGVS